MDEALQYFRKGNGFRALFLLFRQKVQSLGKIGGTVQLAQLVREDMEELALFMGASPHHLVRKGKLELAEFEARLQQTRFAGVSLHTLLEAYFGEKLRSKREEKEQEMEDRLRMLERYKQMHPQLSRWFAYLKERTSDTRWIWKALSSPDFADDVRLLADAYAALPSTLERYPLFSQRAIGDPHALDIGSERGRLWLHLLHVMAGERGAPPTQAEAVNELLLAHQLLRDDIQNFVTQANLLAFRELREHPVWQAAAKERCVLNVPMRELLKLDEIRVAEASDCVYVVENSGVFSALLDVVPAAPLICTHGQFKLAGLLLLDKLAASGYTLCYSGDFDPEGLSMALRFKERYGQQAKLWRMGVNDYYATKPVVPLGDRSGKLDSLLASELANTALAIRENGKIGYQEGLLEKLIEDLRSSLKV